MLLKEDGHLDIDKVESLGADEFLIESSSWGNQHIEEYNDSGCMSIEEMESFVHKTIDELFNKYYGNDF